MQASDLLLCGGELRLLLLAGHKTGVTEPGVGTKGSLLERATKDRHPFLQLVEDAQSKPLSSPLAPSS